LPFSNDTITIIAYNNGPINTKNSKKKKKNKLPIKAKQNIDGGLDMKAK